MNKYFTEENIRMTSLHMKGCKMSVAIWQIQIKTMILYNIKLTKIKQIVNVPKGASLWRNGITTSLSQICSVVKSTI